LEDTNEVGVGATKGTCPRRVGGYKRRWRWLLAMRKVCLPLEEQWFPF